MEQQDILNEQETPVVYEPPALVAVGEFSEDTLGFGSKPIDSYGLSFW
ncbi:lasso RiPP family leader peptide-containing protein [Streptomyces sp. NPDC090303]